MNESEQLIACLEGEIAKRDETIARLEPQLNRAVQANYDLREELAACRVAVENCEVFRARIVELEEKTSTAMGVGSGSGNLFVYGDYDSIKAAQKIVIERDQLRAELAAIKAQEPVAWISKDGTYAEASTKSTVYGSHTLPLYAAPVPVENAQVVVPERWNVPRPMWKDARQPYGNPLNHADIEAAEKFNLALDEVARLNAAPVQQVSVPDGPAKMQWPEIVALVNEVLGCEAHKYPCERGSIGHEMTGINFNSLARIIDRVHRLAAAPAAPAADAGLVAVEWAKDAEEWGPALNEAGWLFLSELNEDPQKSALIFNNCKGPLRAAIMKYAEIVAAHRDQGVV